MEVTKVGYLISDKVKPYKFNQFKSYLKRQFDTILNNFHLPPMSVSREYMIPFLQSTLIRNTRLTIYLNNLIISFLPLEWISFTVQPLLVSFRAKQLLFYFHKKDILYNPRYISKFLKIVSQLLFMTG